MSNLISLPDGKLYKYEGTEDLIDIKTKVLSILSNNKLKEKERSEKISKLKLKETDTYSV